MATFIGKRIKLSRESVNKLQKDLAKYLDLSVDTIWRWENGKGTPTLIQAIEVAKYLRTSVAFLTGETDDPSPIPTFTRETPLVAAGPQLKPEAAAEPAPLTRTPAKIIESIAALNGELETTSGFFTDAEATAAETLLNLCLKNFEAEPLDSSEQETAS